MSEGNFFKHSCFQGYINIWRFEETFRIYIFTHQKTLPHILLLLVFKLIESLKCIFMKTYFINIWERLKDLDWILLDSLLVILQVYTINEQTTALSWRNCGIYFLKIPEHLNKITFWKYPKKQKADKSLAEKTLELLQLMSSACLYN